MVRRTEAAFVDWRSKEVLGRLVSYEMGKIFQEGLGEVQEVIDTCDLDARALSGSVSPGGS